MGEQRLRVLRQSLKRCCTRSSWLAGTDIVLIGCPPSTVEWTADDTNSISKIHAALPKGHKDVETSVKSHITDAHAHPCLFHAILAKGRTAEESNLFKRPIVLIAKEQTRC